MIRKTILPLACVITLLLIVLDCLSRFGAVHYEYAHVGVDVMIALVSIGYQSAKKASVIAMTTLLLFAGAFPIVWFWLVPPNHLEHWPELPYLISLRYTSCIVGCWLAAHVFVTKETDRDDGLAEGTVWRTWIVGCMFLLVCVLSLFHFFCLRHVSRNGVQAMLLVPFASTLFSATQSTRWRSFLRFVCVTVAFLLASSIHILTQDLLYYGKLPEHASWSSHSTAISLHKITGIGTWGRGLIDFAATFYGTVTEVDLDQRVIPLIIGQALTLLIFFVCGTIWRKLVPKQNPHAIFWFKGLAIACSIGFLLQWGKTMQSHQDMVSERKMWTQKAKQIPSAWVEGDWEQIQPSFLRSEYCVPVKRMLREHSFQFVADGMINDGKFLFSVWFLASKNTYAIYRETRKDDSSLPIEPSVWFEIFRPEFVDQCIVLGTNTKPFGLDLKSQPFQYCYEFQFVEEVSRVLNTLAIRGKSPQNLGSDSPEKLEDFLEIYPSSWDRQCTEWIKLLQRTDNSRFLGPERLSFVDSTSKLVDEFIARQLFVEFPELRDTRIRVSSNLSVVPFLVFDPESDPEVFEKREVNLLGEVEFGVCQSGSPIHRVFKITTPVQAVVYEFRKEDQSDETDAMAVP